VPLVRLVLGTQALIEGDTQAAREAMAGEGLGAFNRLMARGALAWFDLPDADAARARLSGAMVGDPLYDGVNTYQGGLIALAAGEEARALATFEALWAGGMRLAFGAEAHARLLAANGRKDEALALIDSFRAEVGHAPGLERLAQRLRAGDTVGTAKLTPRQGAALAFFGPAAAMAAQTGDDLAGVYFTLALALDPDLHVARNLWGDALDRAERFEDSIRVLEPVPESSEYYANARAQLAWVKRRAGRSDEALATAREALARTPDRNLRIQLGDLLNSLGEEAASVAVFTQVIDEDAAQGRAGDWRILHARGSIRDLMGDWDGAKADLRAALALNPEAAETLNHLGYSMVDRGENLTEAFDMIRKAIALQPDAGHIVDSLGWAFYRLGQYERAVEELERAASLMPGDATIADHLGDAYWQVGRLREAAFLWQRATTLDPAPELLETLQAKLAGTAVPTASGLRAVNAK
jgi:tetratricopeptide (TPR) repeat protein